MSKWGLEKEEKADRAERWEYARFVYNWKQDAMEVGNKRIKWPQVWEFFNEMGNDGWEIISTMPMSMPLMGHSPGDTNHLLFVLKRRRI